MDIFEDWKDLSEKFNNLDTSIRNNPRMIDFEIAVDNLCINFKSTLGSIRKRQVLMDTQCITKNFVGDIHEQYHDAINELEANLDNLFKVIKTVLNRVPSVIILFIPHIEKKDVCIKSFGAFLNSLEEKKFKEESLDCFRKFLFDKGKEIDQENNNYRDKYIEHINTNSRNVRGLISDENSIKRIHYELTNEKTSQINQSKEGQLKQNAIQIITDSGENIYYVHVYPSVGIKDMKTIKKGEKFGYVSDNDSGHFRKYGSHTHTFATSRGIELSQVIPGMILSSLEYSPEPLLITEKTIGYLLEVINRISKFRISS